MTKGQLLVIFCCLLPLAAESNEQENRSRLEALKAQIVQLKKSLTNRFSEIDNLADQLAEREIAAGKLKARVHKLETDIAALEAEVTKLRNRQAALEKYRAEQQAMIAREVNAAHRLGRSEPIKLLLNQEDPHQMARTLKYYKYLVKARRDKIEQFELTIAELVTVEQDIAIKQQDLLRAKEENAVELAELAAEQEKRRAVITELNKALSDDNARLGKLNQERTQLEDLIARLEQEIHDLGPQAAEPFDKVRGKLPWPVKGSVRQQFGSTRSQDLKWSGWLIQAGEGAPIKAVHNGRVAFSSYLSGHGLLIILDHGDGYLSLYAHNSLLLKEVGDWVQSGDAIAQAGTTGGLTSSALYFEIRHNGKPQDPKRWLRAQG
jgi:murein hydrolase activator